MNIALGYRWFAVAAGCHFERALQSLGHTVTYVGLPCEARPGYDQRVSLADLLSAWPTPPDLFLWIDPAGPYFPPAIEDLPIPTACYLIDVHLGHWREQAARFDAVFVAQKDHVEAFRQAVGHSQVYWLPLAAAPDVHRAHALPKVYEVAFVGNIARAHRRTPRARRLQLLAQHFRTNDFYGKYMPAEVGEVYSQARIVFNTSIAGDVTMRIFEGTTCGALVLTDGIANGLDELFVPGRELVTYADDADLLGKVAYYLAHEAERAQIAAAGQARTHAQHTYAHRAQTLLDVIGSSAFQRGAPMRTASPAIRRAARRRVYTHLHMLDALLDESRAAGENPIQRAWAALPCLARRLWI